MSPASVRTRVTLPVRLGEVDTVAEVVTFDGTATAKVSITENGTTRSCTQALPRGRLVCP